MASQTANEGPGPSSAGGSSATSAGGSGGYSSMQWLLAWAVLITVLALLAQTEVGYVAIYYALALMILVLLVTQYKWFANVLAPFTSLQPGLAAPEKSGVTGETAANTANTQTA